MKLENFKNLQNFCIINLHYLFSSDFHLFSKIKFLLRQVLATH